MTAELDIKGNITIADLQQEFQKVYPDLRIDFFHHAHAEGVPSEKADAVQPHSKLGEIQMEKKEGSINIDPLRTVAEFESAMRDRFGLSVQVIRRSGQQWIQTTMTDHWTLGQQEEDGHESVEFE